MYVQTHTQRHIHTCTSTHTLMHGSYIHTGLHRHTRSLTHREAGTHTCTDTPPTHTHIQEAHFPTLSCSKVHDYSLGTKVQDQIDFEASVLMLQTLGAITLLWFHLLPFSLT